MSSASGSDQPVGHGRLDHLVFSQMEHSESPLWLAQDGRAAGSNVHLGDLRLSADLQRRLSAWNQNPPFPMVWDLPEGEMRAGQERHAEDFERYWAQGRALLAELRDELGPAYVVDDDLPEQS